MAVVVAGSNGFSPGVTHAHAGGAATHSHGSDADSRANSREADDHGHSHAGHAHSHSHKHPHDHSARVEDCVTHTHANFLGLPITIPATDDGRSSDRQDGAALLVEIVAAPCDVASNGHGTRIEAQLGVPTFSVSLSADTLLSIHHRPNAGHNLLCDTARLERTGVLLI